MSLLAVGLMFRLVYPVLDRIPAERFLDAVPVRNGLVRTLLFAPPIIALHTAGLVIAKAIGGWAYVPFGILIILLSMGFGKAFGTIWWPMALITGFWIATTELAYVDRLGPITLHDLAPFWSVVVLMMFITAFWGGLAGSDRSGILRLSMTRRT